MEHGSGRPDRPALAHATVRAAVNAARAQFPGLPLFAGGKSFGGRMTSQAQAIEPLEGVKGLVFFGFPMHGAGKPAAGRADHLHKIGIPMLFIQGTRDKLAEIGEMQALVKELAQFASLKTIEEGDHSFHVPRRTGRSDHDVQSEFLDAMAKWLISLDPPSTPG
jgi:predicted alpha/beta-hydrolase family hydrolase